ncbi:MAG: cobalamin biosynthesis protein CbiD [Clostridia bacterium]|nr:cobalamin biosynthesis protein CbiD [Clostridia bacterium]MBQ5480737.1 cobalamin biosynthesis protein CbiD [Clostridia bacterium]
MAFEHFVQSGTKQLRCGYTTGTCAALAAEGAAQLLLTGTAPKTLSVRTPKGWTVEVEPELCEWTDAGKSACCAVRKDAGDDPDVTDGMPVVATVSLGEPSSEAVVIDGGDGVGRVTKPGLDQPVGNAAINRVPRQMIRDAVLDVCEELDFDPAEEGVIQVIISIPGGEETAKKTFNPKLGIEGGLSVLGTSGIVEPMSEQALKDTIAVELRQAFALQEEAGVHRPAVLLTPGNYGKDFLDAKGWSDLGVPVVKISNYVGDALDAAVSIGFKDILLAGHIGKLVKVAGNIMNTHSSVADSRMELLAAHAAVCGASSDLTEKILDAATTDAALDLLEAAGLKDAVLARVSDAVQKNLTARAGKPVGAVLFSNVHGLLAVTETAEQLLKHWKEDKDYGRTQA